MSLMSELIKQLRNEADGIRSNIDMDFPVSIGQAKLCEEAADVIEELSAKLHAANMERSSMYYHGGWVPCEERLPEEEEKIYWVCTEDGHQYECMWTDVNYLWPDLKSDWHWHVEDVPLHSRIAAWMPLPTPYTEPSK